MDLLDEDIKQRNAKFRAVPELPQPLNHFHLNFDLVFLLVATCNMSYFEPLVSQALLCRVTLVDVNFKHVRDEILKLFAGALRHGFVLPMLDRFNHVAEAIIGVEGHHARYHLVEDTTD